jgi:hypothetical protein
MSSLLRDGDPHAMRLRSGEFDTGAALQADRISPMEPPRGVPVSNPPWLGNFQSGARHDPLIAATDRAVEAGRAGALAGSAAAPSRVGGAAALLGRP